MKTLCLLLMTVGDNLFKIWLWHKDNSPSLCIIDTALRNRVSVKIGDIIFEMDDVDYRWSLYNTPTCMMPKMPAGNMIMPTKC